MGDDIDLVTHLLPISSIEQQGTRKTDNTRLVKNIESLLATVSNNPPPEREHRPVRRPVERRGPSILRRICGEMKKRPLILVPAPDTHWNQGCLDMKNFRDLLSSPTCQINESSTDKKTLTATLSIKNTTAKLAVVPISQVVKFREKDWDCVVAVCLTGADWEMSQIAGAYVDGKLKPHIKLWFVKTAETPVPQFMLTNEANVNVLSCGRDSTHGNEFWNAVVQHLCSEYEADDNMVL